MKMYYLKWNISSKIFVLTFAKFKRILVTYLITSMCGILRLQACTRCIRIVKPPDWTSLSQQLGDNWVHTSEISM